MVQFTTIAVAALAVLTGTVTAADCTAGRTYCGFELQTLDSRKYAGEPIGQVNDGLMDRVLLANGLRAGPSYRSDYTYTCTAGGNLATPVVYCGVGGCNPVDSDACRPTGGSCCRNGPQPFPPSS